MSHSLTQNKEKELFRLLNNKNISIENISHFLQENSLYINLNQLKNYIYTDTWSFLYSDYKISKFPKEDEQQRLIKILELLIKYGLDVNRKFSVMNDNKVSFKLPLCVACMNAPYLIKTLVENGVDVNKTQEDNESPLYILYVYHTEKLDLIFYLLDKGADPTITSIWKTSPLHEDTFVKLYNDYQKRKLLLKEL